MAVSTSAGGIDGLGGRVVTPADPGYDRTRAVRNAMHDRRPAVIAYCRTVQDVVAAVAHGRAHHLTIAVRGGGHSMPGHSVCDGGHGMPGHSVCDDGIVIDLRGLNAIAVDPIKAGFLDELTDDAIATRPMPRRTGTARSPSACAPSSAPTIPATCSRSTRTSPPTDPGASPLRRTVDEAANCMQR